MININLDRLPINITDHICKFRQFLNISWPEVENLMEFHDWDEDVDFIDDWLDINWQLLVERELLGGKGVLTPLSASLSNKFFKNHLKKYFVEARVSEHKKPNFFEMQLPICSSFRLFGFSTKLSSGGLGLYPPFDTANLFTDSDKKIYSVPFESLEFYLVEYE